MSVPAVSWFVQTAGVRPGEDYRWMALNGADSPEPAAILMAGDYGGRQLLDFVSGQTPAVLLAPRADGAHLLCVGNLYPPDAPSGGDYQGRPIRVALVGIAPAGADATPLLDAAVAVLDGSLVDALPVTWQKDSPELKAGAATWRPPAGRARRASAPRPSESVVHPVGEHAAVIEAVAGLSDDDLRRFPAGRPVLVVNDLLGLTDLQTLRPWRAVTPAVSARTSSKEDKRRRGKVPAAVLVLALVVLAVVVARLVRSG